MVKHYDLKLNPIWKDIVDLYNEVDPRKKYNTASALLKEVIEIKLDKILDYFENEFKKDNIFQELLENKYKNVKEILDKSLRYSR